MTPIDRFERDLPAAPDRPGRPAVRPTTRDDLLGQTAPHAAAPGLGVPERWLPMDITTTPAASPRLPWSAIGVLALVALLIGTVIAVVAGTHVMARCRTARRPTA